MPSGDWEDYEDYEESMVAETGQDASWQFRRMVPMAGGFSQRKLKMLHDEAL